MIGAENGSLNNMITKKDWISALIIVGLLMLAFYLVPDVPMPEDKTHYLSDLRRIERMCADEVGQAREDCISILSHPYYDGE